LQDVKHNLALTTSLVLLKANVKNVMTFPLRGTVSLEHHGTTSSSNLPPQSRSRKVDKGSDFSNLHVSLLDEFSS
jgi:hypothetical protein